MRRIAFALAISLLAGLLPTSCADSSYQPVAYGGITYYYSSGVYYRRYWYGYRPVPRPPGIPEHPIERPPNRPDRPSIQPLPERPDRPTTLPADQRPQTRPATRPVTRPSIQPAPRPAARPARLR